MPSIHTLSIPGLIISFEFKNLYNISTITKVVIVSSGSHQIEHPQSKYKLYI